MKKTKTKYLGFVFISLIITIIACLPLYRSRLFNGIDLTFHLSRIEGLLTSIQDHQFPIALYPYKNYGFGYISPLFYCDLFLLLPAFLYKVGLPLVLAYKVEIFLFTFIGVLLMLITIYLVYCSFFYIRITLFYSLLN